MLIMICSMQSDVRQWATDVRVKVALALVAASTLLAATAAPAPRTSMPPARIVSRHVSVEPVAASVALVPMPEAAPAAGSATPEDSSSKESALSENSPDAAASALAATSVDPTSDDGSATPVASHADPKPAHHASRISAASLCIAANSN